MEIWSDRIAQGGPSRLLLRQVTKNPKKYATQE